MGRKRIQSGETIQFRPGEPLGVLLAEFAAEFQLSRNEAARRLVNLAIRGLPIEIYPYIAELQDLMVESGDFGDACHEFVVAMNIGASGTTRVSAKHSVDEMTWIIQQRLEMLRAMRGIKNDAETVKLHVYVTREK